MEDKRGVSILVVALFLAWIIVSLILLSTLIASADEPKSSPIQKVLDLTVKYLKTECSQPVPCGIEEMQTWESKGHIHYTIYVLVSKKLAGDSNTYWQRRVLIFTLYPDGKLTFTAATLDEEKET